LSEVNRVLGKRNVFILDHHKPEVVDCSVIHFNPHLYGVDGLKEISGAGVCYFFAKTLDVGNQDLSYLALIGAIGDIQEYKGFSGLNEVILSDAIEEGKIEVQKGLSVFGMQTKPLHKVLEYSTDLYIPGVTGSEQGAVKFLQELGIVLRENGKFKKLIHLGEDDMKKLITGIILKRLGSEENAEDVLGPIYILSAEDEELPTKDLREFSTLLNACGRMNKPSLGIGTCLGNPRVKEKALDLLLEYKKEIIGSLNWFYANRGKAVVEKEGYILINAEDNVRETMIGTLASMIAKANLYKDGTVIVSMAHTLDGSSKVSLRVCGRVDVDLRVVVKAAAEKVDGIAGGHKLACGALVSQEKEKEFLELMDKALQGLCVK